MAEEKKKQKLPKGRWGRLSRLGKLAAGLAWDLTASAGKRAVGKARDAATETFHRQAAARLRDVLGQMKGLPMKVGQMISYIDDFIPAPYRELYRETLQELQVRTRPLSWSEIQAVIEGDLGAGPEELFEELDTEPIAAASIGQVYRARLADGREAAVKVQYPGIADAIEGDLKNIDLLKNALAVILPKVDVDRSLGDITARVHEECDYGCELNNQNEFRAAWEGDDEVLIPAPLPEYSGDHVLTSEFVPGISFEEMLASTDQEEKNRLARIMFRFVFRSLYVYGMFNADPHPGNYLFTDDDRVAFIDFGCVQRYTKETIRGFMTVRHLAMDGARGDDFRDAMTEAYGLPDTLDEEEWDFLEEYVLHCFAPVCATEPFRYDREYTEKLAVMTFEGTKLGARKAVKKGIWEAKRPGLVFLNRLQYGFVSILAAMKAKVCWRDVIQRIDAEIENGGGMWDAGD